MSGRFRKGESISRFKENMAKKWWFLWGTVIFLGFLLQICLGVCWCLCNFTSLQLFGETAKLVEMSDTLQVTGTYGVLYPALLVFVRSLTAFSGDLWYRLMYILQLSMGFWAGTVFAGTVFAGIFLPTQVGRKGGAEIHLPEQVVRKGVAGTHLPTSAAGKNFARTHLPTPAAGKSLRILGGLAFSTMPMVMQCHLAILPNSLVCSFLLLQFSCLLGELRQGKTDTTIREGVEEIVASGGEARHSLKKGDRRIFRQEYLAGACLCWLFLSLLYQEYLLFGGIVVVICFVHRLAVDWKKGIGRVAKSVATVGLFFVLMMQMNHIFVPEEYRFSLAQDKDQYLFERFAWGTILNSQARWTEELLNASGYEVMYQVSLYADNVELLLEPALEENLGEEGARELYHSINQQVWGLYRTELFREILTDGLGYAIPPVFLARYLQGSGYGSYNLRNVDVMKRNSPTLTKWYVDYGNFWFLVVCIGGLICWIIGIGYRLFWRFGKKVNPPKPVDEWPVGAYLAGICEVAALAAWYCLGSSGTQDYKLVLFATLMWIGFSVKMWSGLSAEMLSDTKLSEGDDA